MWSELFVKPWQPITAYLWNRLVALVRCGQLLQGPGIRLQYTADGTIISAKAKQKQWSSFFEVSLVGQSRARIRPGLINGVEPVIDKVPLSGDDKHPAPVLEWEELKLDKEDRGYIALEITCGPDWEITKGKVEVVQVAYFDSEDGETPPSPDAGGPASRGGIPGLSGRRVRYPIARLTRRKSGRLEVFQIVHFNVIHRARPRDDQSDIARHFFSMGGIA